MELFIGNLSPEATPAELWGIFRRTGLLPWRSNFSARVVRTLVGPEGRIHHYGRVTVHSERHAKRAVRRFSGQRLHGRCLIVREFRFRAAGNERRALNWRLRAWQGPERRFGERRRYAETTFYVWETSLEVPASSPELKTG